MFFPYCERPSFTPIQNNWQNYGFIYFKLAFFNMLQYNLLLDQRHVTDEADKDG
jgi:hypothetical protein